MTIAFAEFELDDGVFELRREGRRVEVQPKVLDVLFYLARNRERVVTRGELFEKVWNDVAVGDAALGRAVREARRALGDDGDGQRFIKTVHGRGYRFVAQVGVGTPTAPQEQRARPLRDDFVGREDGIATFSAALDGAAAGSGAVVLVAGEPGIGKSRLLDRFADVALEQQAKVLIGRSHDAQGVPPYWPWVTILRDALDEAELGDALRAELVHVRRIVPGLAAYASAGDSEPASDTPQARLRLFDAIARLLSRIARRRPAVILLDDLQWADVSSLGLLEFVAREIRRSRVVIVVAYRDQALAQNEHLTRVVGNLSSTSPRTLRLDGFSEQEIARFIELLTGTTATPAATRALEQATGGNPLFLTHVLHLIGAAEALPTELERIRIPTGMREAIARHVHMLTPESRRMLEVASVSGQTFSLPVVAAAGGFESSELVDPLSEALEARVIRRAAAVGSYEFVHTLIRRALYDGLAASERAQLHEAIGDVLRTRHAELLDLYADELAYHYLRAPQPARLEDALLYATRAAEQAFQKAAFGDAAALYRAALEACALGSRNPRTERQLLLRLGAALGRDGQLADASHAFRAAAAIPRESGAPPGKVPSLDAVALRDSFHTIVQRQPKLAERFYEILFERYAEAKSLFRRDPHKQNKMFADALTAIVDHVEDPPWLRQNLLALGARHHSYGVTDEMYAWVGTSLIATLAEAAGEAWTSRVQRAWTDAYLAITTTMLEGARAAEREDRAASRPSA